MATLVIPAVPECPNCQSVESTAASLPSLWPFRREQRALLERLFFGQASGPCSAGLGLRDFRLVPFKKCLAFLEDNARGVLFIRDALCSFSHGPPGVTWRETFLPIANGSHGNPRHTWSICAPRGHGQASVSSRSTAIRSCSGNFCRCQLLPSWGAPRAAGTRDGRRKGSARFLGVFFFLDLDEKRRWMGEKVCGILGEYVRPEGVQLIEQIDGITNACLQRSTDLKFPPRFEGLASISRDKFATDSKTLKRNAPLLMARNSLGITTGTKFVDHSRLPTDRWTKFWLVHENSVFRKAR